VAIKSIASYRHRDIHSKCCFLFFVIFFNIYICIAVVKKESEWTEFSGRWL